MKKNYWLVLGLILMIVGVILLILFNSCRYAKFCVSTLQTNNPTTTPNVQDNQNNQNQNSQSPEPTPNINSFQPPLEKANKRITKKPFGIFITPKNSPVQPEKFSGYHTGADFEVFPEELNIDVPVKAVCAGSLKLKKYASGYGGVMVQACTLTSQPITVIYGHLKLASIKIDLGQNINVGDVIGILGADKSIDTDGERKHLHLGFYEGTEINIKGYVNSKSELASWVDPCFKVCQN